VYRKIYKNYSNIALFKLAYHKIFMEFGSINNLHKNDKLGHKSEHENTMYYEKYQTIDLAFFLCSTQHKITVQNYHMHVLYNFCHLAKITKISHYKHLN
jgi:hypothetical protein